ncbi:hypothetical protein [uncultured Chitinophaga sp.]|uniref:hypothetical protein n=1 Tax=uncultured Chitinophaga sp. TaxID=339340 RepID=UPI0025EA7B5B|nr:hypothetical protein [uncultured Chitinophaga sp.]
MTKNLQWEFHRSVIDGEELILNGLNIWAYKWKDLRAYIHVKDPIYLQDHTMSIYEITDGVITVLFAAGEFSNMVWGIYLPVK